MNITSLGVDLAKNSWHAPEVECISKGKAHQPYEFGCKVSTMTNVNSTPAPGKPYDGHTLNAVLQEITEQTSIEIERSYVDKGYRGHQHPKKISGVYLRPKTWSHSYY